MSYHTGHFEELSQPEPIDSWETSPLYAPTPGIFDWTTSPVTCSPLPSQVLDGSQSTPPQEPQIYRLDFIRFPDWDKEKPYDEQPPTCIHYLIEWKVTLNSKVITRVTEPDLVISPSVFWEDTLKRKVEGVRRRRPFQNRRVRVDDTCLVASLNDRTQHDLHQQFEGIDIDWTATEKQLRIWGDRLLKGKKVKLDICINYLADEDDISHSKRGDKRGNTSVTKTMLADREAQIDAEQSSGERSVWRDVYKTMRCPGPPCENRDGYCWQDPVGKKHYFLKTHHLKRLVNLAKKNKLELVNQDDIPEEIQTQLYAEEQQRLERQRKNPKYPTAESPCPPINIHLLPNQPPPSSIMPTPACSPPLFTPSDCCPVDPFVAPNIPLDRAVREYSNWQQSRVDSHDFKENITKACDVALSNGLDLEQISKDKDPEFFITHGVIIGVARRFVNDIREWCSNYELRY
ncbi:unnamed protein product [Penicillium salamii]|nr:unnamed protein product [Penicillium salamii]CAG8275978.1 unnamed protein product [Penicillium salamii]